MAVRISLLLAAEATRDLPASPVTVQTPLGAAEGRRVSADVVVVPVLRAGLGMLDAILELIPAARVGHIGLQRDESTAIASQYYSKLPKGLGSSVVLMIDPMLATGGSAVAALDHLSQAGARDIRMICIVAAPEGVELVQQHHPGVRIYVPGDRSPPQRTQVHRAGPRRLRRPALRDLMTKPRATDRRSPLKPARPHEARQPAQGRQRRRSGRRR